VPQASPADLRALPSSRANIFCASPFMPKPMQVMIAEDDALLAIDLAAMLSDRGLQVIGPCSSVEWALQAMAAHQPDVAILDIDLNGHMSFPVADALARLNVPFLWLSGSSPDTLPEHYRVRPFVSKPLVPAVILGELTDLLKRS
jgi:DNA-binding NarL/FixJ family response regulator